MIRTCLKRISKGARAQLGLTLVELMVAMSIGLLITLAALALLASTKRTYLAVSDAVEIQETARYAFENIKRTVHHAGHRDYARIVSTTGSSTEPSIFGFDAHSLKSTSPAFTNPVANSVNGSDILAVRFSGSGSGANGDGTVVNCGGFGIGADVSGEGGWNIYYVAKDSAGEPELRCKYKGKTSWTSAAIARGVETSRCFMALIPMAMVCPTALCAPHQSRR